MKKIMCSFLTVFSMTTSLIALEPSDSNDINQIINHFTYVWNECHGHGSADFYTNDADFVNIFGMTFSGKDEIEARHVAIHEAFLKNSTFEILNVKIRETKPDVVIAHVNWSVSNLQIPGSEMTEMQGIFTHILLKTDHQWKITASQNTPILKH